MTPESRDFLKAYAELGRSFSVDLTRAFEAMAKAYAPMFRSLARQQQAVYRVHHQHSPQRAWDLRGTSLGCRRLDPEWDESPLG